MDWRPAPSQAICLTGNLGLNLELPDPGSEPEGWGDDIEAIARRLAELHQAFGVDFVIGVTDTRTGTTQDIFFIDSSTPNMELLRRMMGDRGTAGHDGN